MEVPSLTPVARPSLPPAQSPAPARRWWSLECNERLLAWVQTVPGRWGLVAAFGLVAQVGGLSLSYVLAAAAFAYLPAWRGWIALGTAGVALARGADHWLGLLEPVRLQVALDPASGRWWVWLALATHLILAWVVLRWVRSHPGSVLGRRPVLSQWLFAAVLALAVSLPLPEGGWRLGLWALLSMVGTQLWVLAYALQDQRSRMPGPLPLQLGLLHPFWRASLGTLSPTPYGKGAAFLRKHQARNDAELARVQLKAFKLLVWALLLSAAGRSLQALAETLGVPSSQTAYAAFLAGQALPWHQNWASLVFQAAGAALALAVLGHKIIAVARLAGFGVPRNTWRPLEARTLADFWNRYYYYFKELLVDFFFLPTFLKVFRRHPRLRVFFATFMAAGVGNAAYHFLRDIHLVAQMGWQDATAGYAGNLFYCAVLALGIGVSQVRLSAGRQLSSGWGARLWSVLCVWGFFVCLQVFGDESRSFSLPDRMAFFLQLFGV